MKPGFDESGHLSDPDLIVKWEQVSQLVIPSTQPPSCPICLSPPTAARAAKCGHLFCFPCIEHYIALSQEKWRKCPICYESIYSSALKPVLFLTSESHDSGKMGPSAPLDIEFTLMRRDLNSTIALPIISYRKWKSLVPCVDLVSALTFSKFISATDVYLRNLFESDIAALSERLADIEAIGDESYESSFIQICLEMLKVFKAINIRTKQMNLKRTRKEGPPKLLFQMERLFTFIKLTMVNIFTSIRSISKY